MSKTIVEKNEHQIKQLYDLVKSLAETSSIREQDIKKLEDLGFIMIYDEEKNISIYRDFLDSLGVPMFSSLEQEPKLYKDTYFIHPEKSICISMEHLFDKEAYNIRYDVGGYMIIDKKDLHIQDIQNNTFWDWQIAFLDDNKLGVSITNSNFERVLEYLEEGIVSDFEFMLKLPISYLLLRIEQSENFPHYESEEKIKKYYDKLISQLLPSFQHRFYNTYKGNKQKKLASV